MLDILPDSRLKQNPTFNSQIVDWKLPDGSSVRVEAQMIYCANCGKPYGYVPMENTTFACYLCRKCFEKHGNIAGTLVEPDDEFYRKVQFEMEAKFGRVLTEVEILQKIEKGELGTALELLERESPFRKTLRS